MIPVTAVRKVAGWKAKEHRAKRATSEPQAQHSWKTQNVPRYEVHFILRINDMTCDSDAAIRLYDQGTVSAHHRPKV